MATHHQLSPRDRQGRKRGKGTVRFGYHQEGFEVSSSPIKGEHGGEIENQSFGLALADFLKCKLFPGTHFYGHYGSGTINCRAAHRRRE